jgi:hypothetical protein
MSRTRVAAALAAAGLLAAGCGSSAKPAAVHHPAAVSTAMPVAVAAMTADQAGLICSDMSAVAGVLGPGTGWTYGKVVAAAVSFGATPAQAPGAVAYIVRHVCPQYAGWLY